MHNAFCTPETLLTLLGRNGTVVALDAIDPEHYRLSYLDQGEEREIEFDRELKVTKGDGGRPDETQPE